MDAYSLRWFVKLLQQLCIFANHILRTGNDLAAKSEGNLQTATAQPKEVSEGNGKETATPAEMEDENTKTENNGNGANAIHADKTVKPDHTEKIEASPMITDKPEQGQTIDQPGTNESKDHDLVGGGGGSGGGSGALSSPAMFRKDIQKPEVEKFVMKCKIPYLTIKSADELPKKFRKAAWDKILSTQSWKV